jgi:type I restriction enzyme M protein
LYSKFDKDIKSPLAIIEAKKKGERLDVALSQGISYAQQLNAPLVFATDGVFCKSYHTLGNTTPKLNGDDVDEFLREITALKFLNKWEVNTISPKVQYGRKELIKVFDEANNMLRGDGLRAGIERFGEFANILFLKLISESEDLKLENGAKSNFDDMCHWKYIKGLKEKFAHRTHK